MDLTIRQPAVSGRFYPSDATKLISLIEKLEREISIDTHSSRNTTVLGGIVPHAGYIYSARHAIPFFKILEIQKVPFDTAVIVCPNHYGYGPPVALDGNSFWQTPLGKVEVDLELGEHLEAEVACEAHQMEHAAEVMVPLLQYYVNNPFRILPVSMREQTPASAGTLAHNLLKASTRTGRKIIVIASSDFSHYVGVEEGRYLDDKVLERIAALDTEGLFSVICMDDISVCGFGPIMTIMYLASHSAKQPDVTLLSRGHSGEITGGNEVVHYVCMLFTCSQQI